MEYSPNTKANHAKWLNNKKTLPNLSVSERQQIHLLHTQKFESKEIARILGCHKSTVTRTLLKIKKTGNYQEAKRSGRPPVVNSEVSKKLVQISEENRKLTAPEIASQIKEECGVNISDRHAARILASNGLHGRIAVKKPLLRDVNKQKRLQFALAHQHWSTEQWKKVLFTDESKFHVFGTHRLQWCRRKKGEELRPDTVHATVKGGNGGVMVWGAMGNSQVGHLKRIVGIMDKDVYYGILKHHGVPSGKDKIGGDWIYQQDNDPKHTAKKCKQYLEKKAAELGFTIMAWPPQSPDLNPIELLWDEVERRVRELRPTSELDLWEKLQQVWNNMDAATIDKLTNRMPALMKMVIKQEGGYFREKGVRNQIKAFENQEETAQN